MTIKQEVEEQISYSDDELNSDRLTDYGKSFYKGQISAYKWFLKLLAQKPKRTIEQLTESELKKLIAILTRYESQYINIVEIVKLEHSVRIKIDASRFTGVDGANYLIIIWDWLDVELFNNYNSKFFPCHIQKFIDTIREMLSSEVENR